MAPTIVRDHLPEIQTEDLRPSPLEADPMTEETARRARIEVALFWRGPQVRDLPPGGGSGELEGVPPQRSVPAGGFASAPGATPTRSRSGDDPHGSRRIRRARARPHTDPAVA